MLLLSFYFRQRNNKTSWDQTCICLYFIDQSNVLKHEYEESHPVLTGVHYQWRSMKTMVLISVSFSSNLLFHANNNCVELFIFSCQYRLNTIITIFGLWHSEWIKPGWNKNPQTSTIWIFISIIFVFIFWRAWFESFDSNGGSRGFVVTNDVIGRARPASRSRD